MGKLATSALCLETAPYVGDTTTTTSTISWVTQEPSIGRVEFGAYAGDLDQVRVESRARKIHELRLDGLAPDDSLVRQATPASVDHAGIAP